MYTTFRQTFVAIHFVYKIKRTMPAQFCIQNVCKSLSKCSIHFVYTHFIIYILYTKFCRNVGYILYTFCIHNSDLQKACIMNIMYNIFMQNSYKTYIQITVCRMDSLFQHILTHLLYTSYEVKHC